MFLLLRNPRYKFNRPYSRLRGNDKNYCLRDIKFPPCPPHKHIRVCGDPGRGNDRGEYARAITKQNAHRTTGPRANIVCVGGSKAGGVSCRARRGVGYNDHPGLRPPLRRGELCPATVRSQFPSIGGVPQRGGVVRDFKKMPLLPIVIASKAWRSSK